MKRSIGLIGALAVLALAQVLGLTAGLDNWLTDAMWRLAAGRTASPFRDVVIIGIDDKTYQAVDRAGTGKKFGRLGDWSRERYARLLDRMAQAKVVGFDILFLDEGADPAGDRKLAQAIAANGRVVVAFNQFSGVRSLSADDQTRIGELLQRATASPLARLVRPVRFENWQPPLPAILAAARQPGYVDVASDSDGVFRRVQPLRATWDRERVLPHFALAVACVATGKSPADLLRPGPAIELGRGLHPLADEDATLPLQPIAQRLGSRGAGHPVQQISFSDALMTDPAVFRDKIVLVGETASGTGDLRPNPIDNGLRGVELNAEIVANLLTLPPVGRVPTGVSMVLILASLGVPLWLFRTFPPRLATGVSILFSALMVTVLGLTFWVLRLIPKWAAVLLAAVSATLIEGLVRLVDEEQQKRQIRRSFGMYVAPEVVAMIADDPSIANQEGMRQWMCVLFSDIRSFTTYCEQNPPELVVAQMREYLSEMTISVDDYKGVLDKFVGDAVMALYGPFLEDESNRSALAVASALDMIDRLEALNARWTVEGWPNFKIGIGLHYGQAILGNIGSERKMQYTALGDTVNTAARLESMTKELKAPIVVSEEVRAEAAPVLGELVEFRALGEITVRNRATPVTVYAVSRKSAKSSGVPQSSAAALAAEESPHARY